MASAFLDTFGEAFGPAFGSIEGHPIFNARVITALNLADAAYDPSIDSACWQDVAGTIPAGNGDPIRKLDDITGNGNHRTFNGTVPPTRRFADGIWFIDHLGVDENLETGAVIDMNQPAHIFSALHVDIGTTVGSQRPGMNLYSAGSNYYQLVVDSDGSVDLVTRGDSFTPPHSNTNNSTPAGTVNPSEWNALRASMQGGQYFVAANDGPVASGAGWDATATTGANWRLAFANRGGNPADVAAPVQREAATLIVNTELNVDQIQLCWEWVNERIANYSVFRILIETDHTNARGVVSNTDQFAFGIVGSGYDCEVDWGDGNVERLTEADAVATGDTLGWLHTYSSPGQYEVTIKGILPRLVNGTDYDSRKWLEVREWGGCVFDTADGLLDFTERVQIVGDALDNCFSVSEVFPVWASTFKQCGSHHYPELPTQGVEFFDRTWYLSKVRTAPMMDTSSMVGSHNLFRSCTDLEGPLPPWDFSNVIFHNRTFRNCRKLRYEDYPEWDYSQVRNMEMMFADQPLLDQPPPGLSFEQVGQEYPEGFNDYGHGYTDGAARLFAGDTHELNTAQTGATSGISTLDGLDFTGMKNAIHAFYKSVNLLTLSSVEFPDLRNYYGLFQKSGLQSISDVRFTSAAPNLVEAVFDGCADLVTVSGLEISSALSIKRLLSNCPLLTTVEVILPPTATVSQLLAGSTNVSSVTLPGYSRTISLQDLSLDRAAINALVDSLADVSVSPQELYLGGNPGFDNLLQADLDAASAKGWSILAQSTTNVVDLGLAEARPATAAEDSDWYIAGDYWQSNDGFLVRSSDSGDTWATVKSDFAEKALWVAPAGPNIVVAMDVAPYFIRSADYGSSWSSRFNVGSIAAVPVLHTVGDHFVAKGYTSGFSSYVNFLSIDGGTNWSLISTPAGYEDFSGASALGLYYRAADDSSWFVYEDLSDLSSGFEIEGPAGHKVDIITLLNSGALLAGCEVAPDGDYKFFISNPEWREENSWTLLSNIGPRINASSQSYNIQRLFQSPNGQDMVIVVSEWGPTLGTLARSMYTPDAGQTWHTFRSGPLSDMPTFALFQVDGVLLNGKDGSNNTVTEKLLYDDLLM